MKRRLASRVILGLLWGLIVTAAEVSILPFETMSWRDQLSVAVVLGLIYTATGTLLGLVLGPLAQRLSSAVLSAVVFTALVLANTVQVILTMISGRFGQGPARIFGREPDLTAIVLHGLWLYLFFGGLTLIAYLLRRRADRTRAFIARSMISARQSEAAIAAARARTLRGHLEPERLAEFVRAVRLRYQVDQAQGDLLLERLTEYLRAAMPAVRRGQSTPANLRQTEHSLRVLTAALGDQPAKVLDHEDC
jgi:hypothetical protein